MEAERGSHKKKNAPYQPPLSGFMLIGRRVMFNTSDTSLKSSQCLCFRQVPRVNWWRVPGVSVRPESKQVGLSLNERHVLFFLSVRVASSSRAHRPAMYGSLPSCARNTAPRLDQGENSYPPNQLTWNLRGGGLFCTMFLLKGSAAGFHVNVNVDPILLNQPVFCQGGYWPFKSRLIPHVSRRGPL